MFSRPSWREFSKGGLRRWCWNFIRRDPGSPRSRRRLPGRAASVWLLLGGLAAILTVPGGGLWRAVCWGLPAAAVVAGTVALENVLGPKIPKAILEIGNASYSIYLAHLFVVPFAWVAAQRLGMTGASALVGIVVLSLLSSIAAGEIVHRLLELPLTNFLRGKRVRGVSVLPA